MATTPVDPQWRRKASLLLVKDGQALDLSAFRFTFQTTQADLASPNNCVIRVFNLSDDTMSTIQGEYSDVVLQAGYESGSQFGIVFRGTVRQYKISKEGVDTFLDILAADSELGYNNAIVSTSLAAGATTQQRLDAIVEGFKKYDIDMGFNGIKPGDALALSRGKVMFGLARTALNSLTATVGTTWNIQNGKVNVIALDGYLPGEQVVLTRDTGLIGRPEQTAEGIRCRCLLNPRLAPGNLVKIDNKSINRTSQGIGNPYSLAYNSNKQAMFLPDVTTDGVYRIFVVEHQGDSRGAPWYSELTCLTANTITLKVKPYG